MNPALLLAIGAFVLLNMAFKKEDRNDERNSEDGSSGNNRNHAGEPRSGNRQRDGSGGVTDDGVVNEAVGAARRARPRSNRGDQSNASRTNRAAEPVGNTTNVQLETPSDGGGRDGGDNAPA